MAYVWLQNAGRPAPEEMMRKTKETKDREALDTEAIKLLKSDPAKYFASTRRQPFGFVPPKTGDQRRK